MNDIDCTDLVIDDATLARCLWLASRPPWTHAPLALRVTPYQMADLLDVEFVDGHAYLGDVPVTTGAVPPPRPRAPVVVEPVVVDLATAKAARTAENTRTLWAHVEDLIGPDEQKALIATQLAVLGIRARGGTPNASAENALADMQQWMAMCMITSAVLAANVSVAKTVEEVDTLVPDLASLPPPVIYSAGVLQLMLHAG